MEEVLAIWALSMITGVTVWTLRAVGKHLERKHQRAIGAAPQAVEEAEEAMLARLAHVEQRVEAVASLEERVLDIEERQDFAERLLAQQDRDRLPGASA